MWFSRDRPGQGSTHLLHDARCLGKVEFGVDLRNVRRAVPQHNTGGFEPELLSETRGGVMPKLIRGPAMRSQPLTPLVFVQVVGGRKRPVASAVHRPRVATAVVSVPGLPCRPRPSNSGCL